ncbi:molecular chaperone TorD family protein [Cereibacter johrii]|uniref:TorD/DmsD family molecular chaperone n=1 Tax=Cereibacter johrii TaxID=445629 RepID=UPI002B25904B|nr:molecular chaperone TorD family protein [Cereibacter johrii]MEA5160251.1 molecular chaperone TorD family protein [Cereibacter johrii]
MTLAPPVPGSLLPVPAPAAGAGELAPLCAWLAEVFIAPPTAPGIGAYRRGQAAAWLESLAILPDFAPSAAAMRQALAGEDSDEALAARLGTAFNRLFLGFGGRRTVVPCESAWQGSGRLYQAPAAEMQHLLARADLSLGAGCVEPPDHISVELALLSFLLMSGDPGTDAMKERLQGWTPAFCARCLEEDTTGFWGGAARLLAAAVAACPARNEARQDRLTEERKAR